MRTTLLTVIQAVAALTAAAQKRAFTISDLYAIENVYGLNLSPDGSRLLYCSSKSNLKTMQTQTTVWMTDTKTLAASRADSLKGHSPVWSSDGKTVYYQAAVGGSYQLFAYDVATGAKRRLTDYALGVSSPVVSPDGQWVAFTADVYPEFGGSEPEKTKARMQRKARGRVQAHLADRLFYRHWTEYSDGRATHLIVQNLESGEVRDLTPGTCSLPLNLGGDVQYAFSPDSRELCYVMNTTDRPEANTNCDLFTVSVDGGQSQNITAGNTAWDGTPQYSPDGRYIAYRRQSVPGYESDLFQLALYDRQTKTSSIVTPDFDYWVNDYRWAADSRSIYFTADIRGYRPLMQLDLKRQKVTAVVSERAIGDFAIGTKGDVYYTYSRTGKPTALYVQQKKKEQQLTFLNQQLEKQVDIRPSEAMWVRGADGDSVEVFVVKPHDFDPAKKYPLVINVHGGPQMQWMDSFRGDWQVYPGAGYVVAYPNPHGSSGYGQKFCRAISGDWGGRVYEDVMLVTDMLEQLPYVDKNRMAAMGWSYGGYMMNWLQGHTKRFRCLASMMGVYDMPSMWGTTEELWFPEFEMQGRPWESSLYAKWSPSQYVRNFATPTLIITGERDYRVSYTQSLQYFSTLQSLGIPSRLIVLQNDGHWPSSLRSMPLYYNAHLEWFHRWLGGGKAPWDTEQMINNETEY